MKELTLRNERLGFYTVLKVINEDEVVSSTIIFDQPLELSVIFPAKGILFEIPKQPLQSDMPRPAGISPMEKRQKGQNRMPDWLTKDLMRRKDGRV